MVFEPIWSEHGYRVLPFGSGSLKVDMVLKTGIRKFHLTIPKEYPPPRPPPPRVLNPGKRFADTAGLLTTYIPEMQRSRFSTRIMTQNNS